jgi:Pyruvate/2-oxoacid:ferredoxin oxidoreductase gamma subunit
MSAQAIEQTLPLALKRKQLVDANRKALYKGAEYIERR